MTAPAVAARYLLAALGIGGALGAFYDFLRPLRPRRTVLADLVFVGASFWLWLVHTFAICGGNSRPGCVGTMVIGGLLWEYTLGRPLRPLFALFWRGLGWPLGKIRKKVEKIFIFLLARPQK